LWFPKAEPQRQRFPGNIRTEILTTKVRQAGALRIPVFTDSSVKYYNDHPRMGKRTMVRMYLEIKQIQAVHWCLQDDTKKHLFR
jgi:hypothetical protein